MEPPPPAQLSIRRRSLSNPSNEKTLPVRPVLTAGSNPQELRGAFRETFLAEALDPETHDVFRAFGKVLSSLSSECTSRWPYSYLDVAAYYLQAGLADLRHLQRFFASWGEEDSSIQPDDTDEDEWQRQRALYQLSARMAQGLGELADTLEKEVGDWKFGD
jgi:hypothetical protein